MKKKECPSCAMNIDSKEKECPICGHHFQDFSMSIQIIAIVLAILMFLFFLL